MKCYIIMLLSYRFDLKFSGLRKNFWLKEKNMHPVWVRIKKRNLFYFLERNIV